MLKSPVNIVSLFSEETLISELRRNLLKFMGRNFDVDVSIPYTDKETFCVREVYFKPNTFQFINLQQYAIFYINSNATVSASISIFVNEGCTLEFQKAVFVLNYGCAFH